MYCKRYISYFSSLAVLTAFLPDVSAAAPVPVSSGNLAPSGPATVREGEVLFAADSVSANLDGGPVTAEGNVRAFIDGSALHADRLEYDPGTGIIVAQGNVSITESGSTVFADRVELSDDLHDAIAENFSVLLEDNIRIAAYAAIREQGARTKLLRAVYTSCDICTADGKGKTPTWQIRSFVVTRDLERRVIRFRHAFLEIRGIPVAFVPFLQSPDPSVERQSGFLLPDIGASGRLGFNIQQPYYFALSGHMDATLAPLYTARQGILWQGEWRRRGKRSYHVLAGGITGFSGVQTDENAGLPDTRWHVFADGHQFLHNGLRAEYTIERVSDNEYLRYYDIEKQGDLRKTVDLASANQLHSNVRISRDTGGASSFSLDTYAFQDLRGTRDSDTTIPLVLPLASYRYRHTDPLAGGRFSAGINLVSLDRTLGIRSRRMTLDGTWKRDILTRRGHRINITGRLRGDLYSFANPGLGNGDTLVCTSSASGCATVFTQAEPDSADYRETRFIPALAAGWSYPLYRRMAGGILFLEPRIQLVAGLADRNRDTIINEDSRSIEFDYAGLFEYNKSTGFDVVEDGIRMNTGLSASVLWYNGIAVEAALGRQFRTERTDAFDPGTGLGGKASDYVGFVDIDYRSVLKIRNRFRFDDRGSFNRLETSALLETGRIRAGMTHLRLTGTDVSAFSTDLERQEELTTHIRAGIARHWYAGGSWRMDPGTGQTIRRDIAFGYEDGCATFGIIFRRDETRVGSVEPDNAVLVRFTLQSLVGGSGPDRSPANR